MLGSFVLPYVSSVKSPQQSIGAVIKHHLCQALGLRYCDTLENYGYRFGCFLTVLDSSVDYIMDLGWRRFTM